YYDNPGQEPEQMRNMSGSPYTALPNAFAYRNAFDSASSCRVAPPADGAVRVASTGDGSSRAMLDINGLSFPLPLRDPRGTVPVQAAQAVAVEPVAAIALVDVPLPRPRPSGPGEIARRPETPAEPDLRIVHFGDKAVR